MVWSLTIQTMIWIVSIQTRSDPAPGGALTGSPFLFLSLSYLSVIAMLPLSPVPDSILLFQISDCGDRLPALFLEIYGSRLIGSVSDRDREIVASLDIGPEYWRAWYRIVETCSLSLQGRVYRLFQTVDLWALAPDSEIWTLCTDPALDPELQA